jgi:integrase
VLEALPGGMHRTQRQVPEILHARLQEPRESMPGTHRRNQVHPTEGQTDASRSPARPAHHRTAGAPRSTESRKGISGRLVAGIGLGLVPAERGYPIDTHIDWEEWKEVFSQAGIKDVRLHDARHTAGTLLGELHVDIHVIQRILGHAQVTTTRIYTDPTDPLTREAANRIGDLLWPTTDKTKEE